MLRWFLFATVLALGLVRLGLAADHDHHLLNAETMQKARAADADLQKLFKPEDKKALGSKPSADDLGIINTTPGAKSVLERHGLTPKSYGLTVGAYFSALSYLMTESQMDKKKAAEVLATQTKETQTNIEFLRKNPQLFSGRGS